MAALRLLRCTGMSAQDGLRARTTGVCPTGLQQAVVVGDNARKFVGHGDRAQLVGAQLRGMISYMSHTIAGSLAVCNWRTVPSFD